MSNEEIARSLDRIERNIETFKVEMKAEMGKVTDDHERRIRLVERWMWTAMGAGLVGAGSGLAALLTGG